MAGSVITFVIVAGQNKTRKLYPPPRVGENGERSAQNEVFLVWCGEQVGYTGGMTSSVFCLLCSAARLHPRSSLLQNWTLITLLSLIGYGLYSTNR